MPEFGIWNDVNVLITVAAIIGAAAQIFFLYNFFSSIFWGKKSVQNPWKSNTLEWTAPVERIHGNWHGDIPEVHRWAYDYSKPGFEDDFVPQTVIVSDNEEQLAYEHVSSVQNDKTENGYTMSFSSLMLKWLGLKKS